MSTPKRVPSQRQVVVICLCFGFMLLGACTARSNTTHQALKGWPIVDHVVDGDTIGVAFPDGRVETVRLLGVDTPETVDPSRPEQCFGAEASAFVAALVPPGTEVRLERDIDARDRYGRLLAYVFRSDDDRFVNAELLRSGMADLSIYQPNDGYVELFRTSLRQAKTEGAGLWTACGGADVAIDPPPVRAD